MIKEKIGGLIDNLRGTAGVAIKDMSTGDVVSFNEEAIFPAASIIKLSILWELFKRIDGGEIDLKDEFVLEDSHKVGGFGILKELHSGLSFTIKDLACLMIVLSDNVATNILIDILGMDRINASIKKNGMKDTSLKRKMMDAEAKEKGLDNYTSPRDTSTILEKYIRSEELFRSSRDTIIDILKRQQCNNKLPVYMPPEKVLAHKTGDLPGTEHDAGILYAGREPIIIVVMTKDLSDNQEGIKFNQDIGKIVFDHFE